MLDRPQKAGSSCVLASMTAQDLLPVLTLPLAAQSLHSAVQVDEQVLQPALLAAHHMMSKMSRALRTSPVVEFAPQDSTCSS